MIDNASSYGDSTEALAELLSDVGDKAPAKRTST